MDQRTEQEITDIRNALDEMRDEQPTLRDRMAMAALTGFIANSGKMPLNIETHDDMALEIYRYADAMMKARELPDDMNVTFDLTQRIERLEAINEDK